MAYTPINWQTGDTITAAKLNRCDNGGSVDSTQLFSETVTTTSSQYGNEGQLTYSSLITSNSIVVTFGGTDYQCPRIDMEQEGEYGYGGVTPDWSYDFSEFPFALESSSGHGNTFATETAGTYAIAASVYAVSTSSDFEAAVNMASSIDASTLPLRCVEGVTTYNEAVSAMNNGRLVYFTANDETYAATPKCFIVNNVGRPCTIVPTSTKIAAKFGVDDGLFYIERLSS